MARKLRMGRWTFLLATPLLCFALLELFLRFTAWDGLDRARNPFELSLYTGNGRRVGEYDGELEMILAPFTIWKNRPSQQTEYFRINSRGLRGPEVSGEEDGRGRLLVLGSSGAFGLGVRDDETIPARLSELAPGFEVLNCGVVAFLSGQELAYLTTELAAFDPILVVSYGGWADLFDAAYRSRGGSEFGYSSAFFEMETRLENDTATTSSPWRGFLRFVDSMAGSSRVISSIERRTGRVEDYPLVADLEAVLEGSLDQYVENMKWMSRFCAGSAARFIAVLQPDLGQKRVRTPTEEVLLQRGVAGAADYREGFSPLYDRFLDAAVPRLSDLGIRVVDPRADPRFSEAPDALFLDAIHTNPGGSRILAEILWEEIQKSE